jgi:hypothetical protein
MLNLMKANFETRISHHRFEGWKPGAFKLRVNCIQLNLYSPTTAEGFHGCGRRATWAGAGAVGGGAGGVWGGGGGAEDDGGGGGGGGGGAGGGGRR